ncbi:DNA adenine methylase [Blastomonas sp. CACIA14H2]|uniref:DNA adenine methylase n=1 Tax=Blastomonas sp. CACIA14H2 TaxID=1419876 RepID=UPI0004CF2962
MESSLSSVQPVSPVAPYIGGKRKLAKRLCAMIDQVDHQTYAEPFVGMGGVFFRRAHRPPCEAINDWSREVHNFFRVLQVHYLAFLEMMRFQITSRAEFERLSLEKPETLTDMQRAARFLYLQRTSFGGKVVGQNFGVSLGRGGHFDVTKLQPLLEAVHERLSAVVIERMRWADFMRRYDRPGTLFYIDPPYYRCEADYGDGMFDRAEFAQMAELLAGLKGRFILSINDHPEIRATFARFHLEPVQVGYSIGGGNKQAKFGELIITPKS